MLDTHPETMILRQVGKTYTLFNTYTTQALKSHTCMNDSIEINCFATRFLQENVWYYLARIGRAMLIRGDIYLMSSSHPIKLHYYWSFCWLHTYNSINNNAIEAYNETNNGRNNQFRSINVRQVSVHLELCVVNRLAIIHNDQWVTNISLMLLHNDAWWGL